MPDFQGPRLFSLCVLFFTCVGMAYPATEIEPIGRGDFELGSSNMELVDKFPNPLIDYLKGKSARTPIYIASILARPETALVTQVKVPDNREIYGSYAGSGISLALYIVYPTTKDNPRASYKFPYKDTGDNVFPHMQRPGEKPIFADSSVKYPVIFYSHGYEAHGLWDLERIKYLASHGFIVVSIFHGDGRFGFFDSFPLRPLLLKSAMDFVLSHPDFSPAIDMSRVGVSGSSMGGYTILAAMGGRADKNQTCQPDVRIKAGFGLVPFTGAFWRHPFGRDRSGLNGVTIPFMAICAEKDKSVPLETVLESLGQMSGTRSALCLANEEHLLSKSVWPDVNTWELLFFNAWLRNDAEARACIYGDKSVRGGGVETKIYQRLVEKTR